MHKIKHNISQFNIYWILESKDWIMTYTAVTTSLRSAAVAILSTSVSSPSFFSLSLLLQDDFLHVYMYRNVHAVSYTLTYPPQMLPYTLRKPTAPVISFDTQLCLCCCLWIQDC